MSEQGAEGALTRARKSFSFYWQVARIISLVVAAMSALTLIRDGQLVPFPEFLVGWLNSFAVGIELLFVPVERGVEYLLMRLGFDVTLSGLFRVYVLLGTVNSLSLLRHGYLWRAAASCVFTFLIALVTGLFLPSEGFGPEAQFLMTFTFFVCFAGIFLLFGSRITRDTQGIDYAIIVLIVVLVIAGSYLQASLIADGG